MYVRNLLFVAIAFAASTEMFAQSNTGDPSGANRPSWTWSSNYLPQILWRVDQRDLDDSDHLNIARQTSSAANLVTLHQLAHKVPGKARKEFELATKSERDGDSDSAVAHLRKAITIDPEYYEALNNLGVHLLRSDRIDLGIKQLTKAIAIDPHEATAYLNLASAFLVQNRYADAELTARQEVSIDHIGLSGPFILGESLIAQKKLTPEAEVNLRKAADRFVEARIALAIILAARGECDAARAQLQMYLASGDLSNVAMVNRLMNRLDSQMTLAIASSKH